MSEQSSLLGHFVDGHTNFLVTEWCQQGSLAWALGPEGCFARGMAEGKASVITLQICQALSFLHALSLPHG